MSDFAFHGYLGRIMGAFVDTMMPRWPNYEPQIHGVVFNQIESLIRSYPRRIRIALMAFFLVVDLLSGPLTLSGIRRWSSLSLEERTRRLERLKRNPIKQFALVIKFLKIIISMAAYSHPEVESHLGVDRRAWRRDRYEFRNQLVAIDEQRTDRPVPEPLGAGAACTPETYLRFADERRAGPDSGATDPIENGTC